MNKEIPFRLAIVAVVAMTAATAIGWERQPNISSYPVQHVLLEQMSQRCAAPSCAAPACCGTPAYCQPSSCCTSPPSCRLSPLPYPPSACYGGRSKSSPIAHQSAGLLHRGVGNGVQVEHGANRPVLDMAGRVVSLPKRIVMWDSRVDNHNVSTATVDQVTQYLQQRNVPGMVVRVNQYAPLAEWKRLVKNPNINPVMKFTMGTVRQVRYTMMPGRLFGGDEYNPYTNTLSLYSDAPAIGISEAVYARDVNSRRFPGLFTVTQSLPVLSLVSDTRCTAETLDYLAATGSPSEVAATRRLLYARAGNQVFGDLGRMAPNGSMLLQLGTVGVAHIAASRENARTQY